MHLHIEISGLGCLLLLAVIAGIIVLAVWGSVVFPAVAICFASVAVIAIMFGMLPR